MRTLEDIEHVRKLAGIQRPLSEKEKIFHTVLVIEEEKLTRQENQAQKINTHPKYPCINITQTQGHPQK